MIQSCSTAYSINRDAGVMRFLLKPCQVIVDPLRFPFSVSENGRVYAL